MSKERADQENPPSTVESVAGPEGGDGGSLGECEDGSAAAAMPGQPAVVPLSPEDLGRVADVVLGPVDGADRRPEPDRMEGQRLTSAGRPMTANRKAPRRPAQRQQTVRRTWAVPPSQSPAAFRAARGSGHAGVSRSLRPRHPG